MTFHLAEGPLALFDISFFVSDGDPAGEELLEGQLVLRYLCIDLRTLLELWRERLREVSLGESEYSESRKKLGAIGQIMLAKVRGANISEDYFTTSRADESKKEINVNQKDNQILDDCRLRTHLDELRNDVDFSQVLHSLIPMKWIKKSK